MRIQIAAILVATAVATMAGAQESALAVSTSARPVIDGVVQPGEYTLTRELRGATLSLARTADRVYIALSAQTTGWVAVGTGTGRMDGSRIFIGFVKDGAVTFEEDLGRYHTHGAAPDASDAPFAAAHALTESGGRTTIEVELDAAKIIAAGATELRLIAAYGGQDSLSAYHRFRTSLVIPLG
jgi:hypothetical protein